MGTVKNKDLIKSLIEIQNKLKAPKDKDNDFGGFNYRSIEDILEKVKPLLKERALLLTLTDKVISISDHNYIKATAKITDGESEIKTVALAREKMTHKKMDEAQLTGSASSYARKYALGGLFLLDDNKDPDSPDSKDKKPEITSEQLKRIKELYLKKNGEDIPSKTLAMLSKVSKDDAEKKISDLEKDIEKMDIEEIDVDSIELEDNE